VVAGKRRWHSKEGLLYDSRSPHAQTTADEGVRINQAVRMLQ
jgi:hypothetical protein